MKLNDWRISKNMSFAELARKIGAPHAKVVHRWCVPNKSGHFVTPSRRYMKQIVLGTQGAVQANDFY